MSKINIKKINNLRIKVTDLDNGGSIETQSVEANLLYAILDKLEELRCCSIDIEDAIDRNQK